MLIMPLFHVHGLLASFLSPLYSGGSAIIPPRLEPTFWETFTQHKANWYTATPSMHRLILQFPPPEPVPDIRFIRSCSSQLAPSLYEKLEKAYKAPVLESYAMTEASHLMTSNPLPPAPHYPGTVGQSQGDVEVRILDQDGAEVQQGGEGEVCIRGPNVTKGYLNNEDANKSSFTENRFFRTGDQGKLDKEGYLTLTGRLKEMINKGGEKVCHPPPCPSRSLVPQAMTPSPPSACLGNRTTRLIDIKFRRSLPWSSIMSLHNTPML